jgi:hypothetical protein
MGRTTDYNAELWSAIQQGKVFKTYRKTSLGKVYVQVYNPFTGEPEGILLEGEAGKDQRSFISTNNEMEDVFFHRMNRRHFETGDLIEVALAIPVDEKAQTLEQSSDAELVKLLGSKFYSLKGALERTKSESFLYRLLSIAREEEKSEKYIQAIEKRIAELQGITVDIVADTPQQ